jgi:hypothetical protein
MKSIKTGTDCRKNLKFFGGKFFTNNDKIYLVSGHVPDEHLRNTTFMFFVSYKKIVIDLEIGIDLYTAVYSNLC